MGHEKEKRMKKRNISCGRLTWQKEIKLINSFTQISCTRSDHSFDERNAIVLLNFWVEVHFYYLVGFREENLWQHSERICSVYRQQWRPKIFRREISFFLLPQQKCRELFALPWKWMRSPVRLKNFRSNRRIVQIPSSFLMLSKNLQQNQRR